MVEPVWHPFYRYVSPNGEDGNQNVSSCFYRYASPNGDGGA